MTSEILWLSIILILYIIFFVSYAMPCLRLLTEFVQTAISSALPLPHKKVMSSPFWPPPSPPSPSIAISLFPFLLPYSPLRNVLDMPLAFYNLPICLINCVHRPTPDKLIWHYAAYTIVGSPSLFTCIGSFARDGKKHEANYSSCARVRAQKTPTLKRAKIIGLKISLFIVTYRGFVGQIDYKGEGYLYA